MLLYKLDKAVPARGVRSSSASSEMSHTLGAPSNEPAEAGRMPEPYRSWGLAGSGRSSMPRGLRARLGDRSGDEERPKGMGEGEKASGLAECMTVGSEWARAMGGALSALEPL